MGAWYCGAYYGGGPGMGVSQCFGYPRVLGTPVPKTLVFWVSLPGILREYPKHGDTQNTVKGGLAWGAWNGGLAL